MLPKISIIFNKSTEMTTKKVTTESNIPIIIEIPQNEQNELDKLIKRAYKKFSRDCR